MSKPKTTDLYAVYIHPVSGKTVSDRIISSIDFPNGPITLDRTRHQSTEPLVISGTEVIKFEYKEFTIKNMTQEQIQIEIQGIIDGLAQLQVMSTYTAPEHLPDYLAEIADEVHTLANRLKALK